MRLWNRKNLKVPDPLCAFESVPRDIIMLGKDAQEAGMEGSPI